jgi:opacity protein-like surface antigen
MRLRGSLVALLVAAAPPLHADSYLTPYMGAGFGGRTDDSKIAYGGSVAFASEHGVLGVGVDLGHTPDFLGTSGLGNNNVTSLMGNLMLLTPGRTRFYTSGGVGLMKTRVEDVDGFFRVDSNDFGVNLGGGVMLFPSDTIGLRADLRYFRNLTDPEPDAEFDVDLGGLDFWQATGGITFRF